MVMNLINNYILENKEIIRKYICKKNNSTCSFYITKGKYKNTICGRKIVSSIGYCKVHSKYNIQSKEPLSHSFSVIELTELIYNGKKLFKTVDNIVYDNFNIGYHPIGTFDTVNNILIPYEV